MVKYKIHIPLKLPSWNDHDNAARSHWSKAAKLKKETESLIIKSLMYNDHSNIRHLIGKIKNPVKLHFTWYEANRKRDEDNVKSAKKFLIDALVKGGWLPDDSPKYVSGITDAEGIIYGGKYGVTIEIEEIKERIMRDRISLRMTAQDIIMAMSKDDPHDDDFNLGCLQFLIDLTEQAKFGGGIGAMWHFLTLDRLRLYGSRAYMLWNDCCNRNIEQVELVLLNHQKGHLSKDEIEKNLNAMRGKPFENLKSFEGMDVS